MIISHTHRYVFIQFPHTACTAVGRELVEHYDGEPILFKHAAYHDFLRWADPAMKDYFVFSSIRNPLDEIISFYYKLKTNHRGEFTSPERLKKNGGWVTERILRRYRFIRDTGADFDSYLKKFYKMPYVNWSVLGHKKFDYIIRFETLQEDFSEVLQRIGVDQVRKLPLVNPTSKDDDLSPAGFQPGNADHAKWVFGPIMKYWEYPFPDSWGDAHVPWTSWAGFYLMVATKVLYWRYVR